MGLQQLLEKSMERGELSLVYQPIFDLGGKSVESAEALLRNTQLGTFPVPVLAFAAEEGDGARTFEPWMINRALTDAKQWRGKGLSAVPVQINVSARGFENENIPDLVLRALEKAALPAEALRVELTETRPVKNLRALAEKIEVLHRAGVGVWLDDFGTGHSSLAWLQALPVDGVKLPTPLVGPLPDDSRCSTIVRTVIGMVHDLGGRVIAEGVETEQQLECLAEAGCDAVQGKIFSGPLEPAALMEAYP